MNRRDAVVNGMPALLEEVGTKFNVMIREKDGEFWIVAGPKTQVKAALDYYLDLSPRLDERWFDNGCLAGDVFFITEVDRFFHSPPTWVRYVCGSWEIV